MNATPTVAQSPEAIYEALESYDWDGDVEFQSGLSAILGSDSSPEQAAELTLRARCFYYTRKYNTNIDFDGYRAYHNSYPTPRNPTTNGTSTATQPTTTVHSSGITPSETSTSEPQAPYPASFAQIVELITTGQPIPGIKDIPNTVLTGQGTEAVKARRKKPWEKDESTVSTGDTMPASES